MYIQRRGEGADRAQNEVVRVISDHVLGVLTNNSVPGLALPIPHQDSIGNTIHPVASMSNDPIDTKQEKCKC